MISISDIPNLEKDIVRAVRIALEEDVGVGDITAQLIPDRQTAEASIVTREDCVVCGIPWVNEVFRQLDPGVTIDWQVEDGEKVTAGTRLCSLKGNTRSLLTGERSALNFLQLLSGTATTSRQYADLVKNSGIKILDTRKTIPGFRTAQKYAVRCGGCYSHRMGLFDAFLIKENHIAACGGIKQAVTLARQQHPDKTVEVEVENLEEMQAAMAAGVDVVMLDNFSEQQVEQALSYRADSGLNVAFEKSGNIEASELPALGANGIDYTSLGSLTKHVRAIDLSMRIKPA